VLHPQHETSCDSETQTKEDFKSKFRKQLGSLALMSLNNTDKKEALEYQSRITEWIEFKKSEVGTK